MNDYYEIDFLAVETKKSGDAISMRYRINGATTIHIVDGGYQSTGETLVAHINAHYGNPSFINHVVLTHHDGDHAVGLREVLESFEVGELWMLKPWDYADDLIGSFERFTSVEGLKRRLKEDFPNILALEEIATRKKIPIREPFQGAKIGAFTVMTPTKARYIQLLLESEKTPKVASASQNFSEFFSAAFSSVKNIVRAAWGDEVFPTEDTSAENEMSVVQYAEISGSKILLTGDTGRAGLTEAAEYAPCVGLSLPGIDRFQVPHHGSRRNVTSDVLDQWLGKKLTAKPVPGNETFSAFISSG